MNTLTTSRTLACASVIASLFPNFAEADFFKDLEASIMSAKDYAPSEIAAALHNGLLT